MWEDYFAITTSYKSDSGSTSHNVLHRLHCLVLQVVHQCFLICRPRLSHMHWTGVINYTWKTSNIGCELINYRPSCEWKFMDNEQELHPTLCPRRLPMLLPVCGSLSDFDSCDKLEAQILLHALV